MKQIEINVRRDSGLWILGLFITIPSLFVIAWIYFFRTFAIDVFEVAPKQEGLEILSNLIVITLIISMVVFLNHKNVGQKATIAFVILAFASLISSLLLF